MLAWILNTPLLFEDSSNVLFFKIVSHYLSFEIDISLKYFTTFNWSNMLFNIWSLNMWPIKYYSID